MDTVEDKNDKEYNQSSSPPSIGKEPEGEYDHNQVVVPEAVDCRVCKDLDQDPKVFYVLPRDVLHCGFCKMKTTRSSIFNHMKYCEKNPITSKQSCGINKLKSTKRSHKWNKKNEIKVAKQYVVEIVSKKDNKKRRIFYGHFLFFLSPTNPFLFHFK